MKHHLKQISQRLLHPLRTISWWQLLIVFTLFSGVAIISLRNNSLRMGELKQQVNAADQSGEEVYERLADLASFVYNHMNTSTDVSLGNEYQRAQDVYDVKVANLVDESGNQQLYDAARAECDTARISLPQRAACVRQYVEERSDRANVMLPAEPRPEQYSYSFSAPILSLDLAGVSLAVSLFSGLTLMGKITHILVIKNYRS